MRDSMSGHRARLAAVVLIMMASGAAAAWELTKKGTVVSYDRRSLMVDGRREIFFSGSIHYPRSPPDMWPDLIAKAKEGGLNVIESYVFWNIHEPEKGVVSKQHVDPSLTRARSIDRLLSLLAAQLRGAVRHGQVLQDDPG